MVANTLIFAETEWFLALPAVLVLGTALWFLARRIARRRINRFISADFGDAVPALNWGARLLRFILTGAALAAFAVTLARPLTGPKSDRIDRSGVDFVIALDVSKSMWVGDVPPTRLAAVKSALTQWLKNQTGDRIGLIVFAGEAFVQAPLTFDYTALDFVLQEAGPASVSKGGTNIPKAIEVATKMLTRNKLDTKAMIIISDGENLELDAVAAARTARVRDGVTIYTVGVGTSAGGKVPTSDPTKPQAPRPGAPPGPPYVRNEYGIETVSRFDKQSLRSIAAAGGGKYYEFQPGQPVFQTLREQSLMPLARKSMQQNVRDFNEWFQVPLGIALLLLVLEPLIPTARRRKVSRESGVAVVQPTTFSKSPRPRGRGARPVAVAVFLAAAGAALGAPTDEADRLIAEGKIAEAADYLRDQTENNEGDAYLQYNYALALYRAKKFEEAATVFESVAAVPEDRAISTKALLQTGNSQYQLAEQLTASGNTSGSVLALERSLSTYDTLLGLRSDKAARHNRELTAKRLETLLVEVGASRAKIGGENALRQAVEAYERATELNKKNEPLAVEARNLLMKELARQAREQAKAADAAEAAAQPAKQVLAHREGAITKFEEALILAPDNKDLQAGIKEQQDKMSDLLVRVAKEQADPIMSKEQLQRPENLKLEDSISKLNEALSLNEKNEAAKELKGKIEDRLVASYNAGGENLLKELEAPHRKLGGKLFMATKAAEAFNSALAHKPDDTQAKEGLAKAEAILPELNAKVAAEDMAKAAEMAKGKGGEPAKADALQGASGLLEKAVQNFGTAAGMKPDNPEYQKGLGEAQGMLEGVRSELDKLAAAGQPGNAPGEGEGEGEGSEAGPTESLNALRGKGGGIVSQPGRFWENKVRDW